MNLDQLWESAFYWLMMNALCGKRSVTYWRLTNMLWWKPTTALEAYTMFTQGNYDLVMTDFIMPFISGDELAVRIRQLVPQQPILMMTAHDFQQSPSNPVNAVLFKPFDYVRLQQEIAKLF